MSAAPLFLAGMPGAGKSSVGRAVAARLGRPFVDLDDLVAARAGRPVAAIFAAEGEAAFRAHEATAVTALAGAGGAAPVVALGGGTLVNPVNRARLAAAGRIVVLDAPLVVLAERLAAVPGDRPLLGDDAAARWPRLAQTYGRRRALFAALPWHVATAGRTVKAVADAVVALAAALDAVPGTAAPDAGAARSVWVPGRAGGGHRLVVGRGVAQAIGAIVAAEDAPSTMAFVSEATVAPLHAGPVASSLATHGLPPAVRDVLAAGEAAKDAAALVGLWERWQAAGVDRDGHVVALGGGALTDVAGFAAATYLRGVGWTAVPTTLLAMVDAALGGKTAINLPGGKNLAGAFHPPRRVVADLDHLATLPPATFAAGLAEVVKAAVIGDAALLAALEARVAAGYDPSAGAAAWPDGALAEVIARAAAVKAAIVGRDPRERPGGRRVVLNLGHTFAHGLEHASGHRIGHGAAVAVGLVLAARLARRTGALADAALPDRLAAVLAGLGLPVDLASAAAAVGIEPPAPAAVQAAMAADKKRAGGRLRFVLPAAIEDVRLVDGVAAADVAAVVAGG